MFFLSFFKSLFEGGFDTRPIQRITRLPFILGLTSICIAFGAHAKPPIAFDQASEFPNLLLPPQYRNLPIEEVPDTVIQSQRAVLEEAVASVMRRITVPLVNESGQLVEARYFSYLLERAQKIDKAAQIIPSGGVVRSAISYIYDEMRKGKSLAQITAGKEAIPAADFRSIGGDFDVFARSPNGKFDEVAELIKTITNSAEEKYRMTQARSAAKRQFFTIADVKDFDNHWQRSVGQGGSTLDFLGFHFTGDGGKFLEPPEDKFIVSNLIRGRYRYIAGNVRAEDLPKQVVRGFRALVELPWLRIEDPTVLIEEATAVLTKIEKGELDVSPKVYEQFAKLVRNARYHGANNRFHRAASDSVEHLILRISQALSEPGQPLLPEFLQAMPNGRQPLPTGLAMSSADFQRYTDNGILYHGTPMLEHAMAIMRNGLFVSAETQGTSAFGYGTYSSGDVSVAKGYAGGQGLVLELGIKPEATIVDWNELKKNRALFEEILTGAQELGIDPKRYFSQRYNVDVIIDTHVLIQNANIVEYPNGMRSLLLSMRDQAMDAAKPALSRLLAMEEFHRSLNFLHDLGTKIGDVRVDSEKFHREIVAAIDAIGIPESTEHQNLLLKFLDYESSIPEARRAELPRPKNFRTQLVHLALDLELSIDRDQVDRVAKAIGIDKSKITEFIEASKNSSGLSVEAHKENVASLAERLGFEHTALEKNRRFQWLLDKGRLKAADAFAPSYSRQTAALATRVFIEARGLDKDVEEIIRFNPETFRDSPEMQSYIREQLLAKEHDIYSYFRDFLGKTNIPLNQQNLSSFLNGEFPFARFLDLKTNIPIELKNAISNVSELPVEDLLENTKRVVANLGIDPSKISLESPLFDLGILNSPDAFNSKHIERTAAALSRILLSDDEALRRQALDAIKKNSQVLSNSKSFQALLGQMRSTTFLHQNTLLFEILDSGVKLDADQFSAAIKDGKFNLKIRSKTKKTSLVGYVQLGSDTEYRSLLPFLKADSPGKVAALIDYLQIGRASYGNHDTLNLLRTNSEILSRDAVFQASVRKALLDNPDAHSIAIIDDMKNSGINMNGENSIAYLRGQLGIGAQYSIYKTIDLETAFASLGGDKAAAEELDRLIRAFLSSADQNSFAKTRFIVARVLPIIDRLPTDSPLRQSMATLFTDVQTGNLPLFEIEIPDTYPRESRMAVPDEIKAILHRAEVEELLPERVERNFLSEAEKRAIVDRAEEVYLRLEQSLNDIPFETRQRIRLGIHYAEGIDESTKKMGQELFDHLSRMRQFLIKHMPDSPKRTKLLIRALKLDPRESSAIAKELLNSEYFADNLDRKAARILLRNFGATDLLENLAESGRAQDIIIRELKEVFQDDGSRSRQIARSRGEWALIDGPFSEWHSMDSDWRRRADLFWHLFDSEDPKYQKLVQSLIEQMSQGKHHAMLDAILQRSLQVVARNPGDIPRYFLRDLQTQIIPLMERVNLAHPQFEEILRALANDASTPAEVKDKIAKLLARQATLKPFRLQLQPPRATSIQQRVGRALSAAMERCLSAFGDIGLRASPSR